MPGRSTEEKGREEGEEDEGSGERQVSNEMIQEVIRSSQMLAFEECCQKTKEKGRKDETLNRDGIARRLRLKKKMKAGKKATKWQNNGNQDVLLKKRRKCQMSLWRKTRKR